MSEELNNPNGTEPVQEQNPGQAPDIAVSQQPEEVQNPAPESEVQASAPTSPSTEPVEPPQPQIIVQKERGFSHYVGFALLSVLCICFFFMPGIAVTYAVSCAVPLTGAAAWIFSAILSVIAWLIFKLKIKGFKKSFYFYIGLCVAILAILIAIQVATDSNIFAGILSLLTGAKA